MKQMNGLYKTKSETQVKKMRSRKRSIEKHGKCREESGKKKERKELEEK